ncbi:diaminopimelate decarboxylase [Bdellovibrio sp. HCB337]|uniref:diaminopimelate decarboxylase n=1 Tax=Bdellovibrio sp. HCB337 TaxID=3394358 RepID=UPI0039A5FCEB
MSKAKLYLQYEKQKLVLGPQKKALFSLVSNYQRPTYVYDLDILKERVQIFQKALPGVQVYYAMKANSHPQVLQCLHSLGCGLDVVSGGEIRRAQECGFKPQALIYSGVGKTHKEIRQTLEMGLEQINVESIPELRRIAKIAKEMNKKTNVVFRLNPDVDIETHPYIATGLHNNKFGMAFTDLPELKTVLKENSECLIFKGVSLHLGSQMHNLSGFRDALKLLRPVYEDLQKEFPSCDTFDVGGGLGIFYDTQEIEAEEKLLQDYANIVFTELKGLRAKIQTEPGRWLVAHAGVLLTQVQYLKKTSVKNFAIVDTGMHHLLRPTLYGAHHRVWTLNEKSENGTKKYDVVGPICESGDFLASDRDLSELQEGDFLVIGDVGAYGFVMRSDYNLQDPPEEVFL